MDVKEYMTLREAAEAVGTNLRGLFRVLNRCREEGVDPRETVLGRTVIKRSALPILVAHYYPYYSEAHQRRVKEWGAAGGSTKAANRRLREAATAARVVSDTSGTGGAAPRSRSPRRARRGSSG